MSDGSSDLDRIRATPIPRDEALCRQFAARFEPPSLRVAFGALWLVLSAFVFASIPMLVAAAVVQFATGRPRNGSTLLLVVMAIVWLAAFIVSWLPFARWMRRRAAEVNALLRDGKLVDARATAESNMYSKAGVVHVLSFTFTDDERMRAFSINVAPGVHPAGQSIPVLCHAGSRRCAIFLGGRLKPLRTR